MIWIVEGCGQWIVKYGYGFVKGYFVLLKIAASFLTVPFKSHPECPALTLTL